MSSHQPITRFNPGDPCPVCESGSKGCSATSDGLHFCRGEPADPAAWRVVGEDANGFHHYRRVGETPPPARPQATPTPAKDWLAEAERYAEALIPSLRVELASTLRLQTDALAALPLLGWDGQAWTFPECDGTGCVIGIARRFRDGKKGFHKGGKRGLILPAGWDQRPGPLYVVEGASDPLAMAAAGLCCVGRPNDKGGVEYLRVLLADWPKDRGIVITGENDQKPDGRWPGREGAERVASSVAAKLGREILISFPPPGSKDVRDWLTSRDRGRSPWHDRGAELQEHLEAHACAVACTTFPATASSAVPQYIPFPVDCLPEEVQPFVRMVAEATNTDPAFVSVYLLSLMGAMVGATRVVMPKRGWRVFPTVWAAAVGRSSSGKSPPLQAVNDALNPLIEEARERHVEALEAWERAKAETPRDQSKKGHPVPPEPPEERLRVGDTTIEALAGVLHHNPQGVWLSADELANWFGGFTRYKSGKDNTDRPKWLALFDGGSEDIDRKSGQRHIHIRNTVVGVAGGIQPKILKAAMTDENLSSGLFARILVAFPPDRLTQWTEAEVTEEASAGITALLRKLRGYDFAEKDGRKVPKVNTLHPDAKARFVAFYNANRRHAHTADDAEAAAAVKLESYALKFAHIRHLCRCSGGDDSPPISAEDMAAGIELAAWFLGELQRVRVLLAEPEQRQGNRRLADWIRQKGGTITARQLQRHDDRRYPTADAARVRLEQLAADGFGEWQSERASNGKSVERFVLFDQPPPDARHCPTPPPNTGEAVPDTALAGVSQTPYGVGDSGTVSSSVGRRTGVDSAPFRATPVGAVSGRVSGISRFDTSIDDPPPAVASVERTPPERIEGGTDLTETGPVASTVIQRPVWEDFEAFIALMTGRGWTWPRVLQWLNAPPGLGFYMIPAGERRRAVLYLQRLPPVVRPRSV